MTISSLTIGSGVLCAAAAFFVASWSSLCLATSASFPLI